MLLALSCPAPLAPVDLFGVGLVVSIVGCFLLANSILFRHPRTLVADFFKGAERRLTSIREYIFHRVQVHLGFLFLLLGFTLQLFGHYQPVPEAAAREFPVLWVGVLALAVVVLELLGWWASHALFRRYVREHFLEHPPSLEVNMRLARELGELLGVPPDGDDSVQSYILRIRRKIGLPVPDASSRRREGGPAQETVEEELEIHS